MEHCIITGRDLPDMEVGITYEGPIDINLLYFHGNKLTTEKGWKKQLETTKHYKENGTCYLLMDREGRIIMPPYCVELFKLICKRKPLNKRP
jgi:hypothetical protein